MATIRRFDDADALMQGMAEWLCTFALAAARPLQIALSGGETPRALFAALTNRHRLTPENEAWALLRASRWYQVDERVVPLDHPRCNFTMIRDALFAPLAISGTQIERLRGDAEDLAAEAERYERLVLENTGAGGLDLVLLGLGDDGHTASLFPGSVALDEEERWVACNEIPSSCEQRLTLTYPALNAARHVAFLVSGQGKARAVRRVLIPEAGEDALPASRVRPLHAPVIWFLDQDAASALP